MEINKKSRNLLVPIFLFILLILTIGICIYHRWESRKTQDRDEKAIHMLLEKEIPSFGNIK